MNRDRRRTELELLRTYDHSEVWELYRRLYVQFLKDRELDEQDLQTPLSLQQATGLTDTEIAFESPRAHRLFYNRLH
jgi:hypothetical protein